MVKPNKKCKFNIESVVAKINEIVPVEFVDIGPGICGAYHYPDEQFPVGHIEIGANNSPIVNFQSIVHEFAHFVDICENGNANSHVIDCEVVAFAVEYIVVNRVPVHVAIRNAEKRVRASYNVGFSPVSVEQSEIEQVVDRVKSVIE